MPTSDCCAAERGISLVKKKTWMNTGVKRITKVLYEIGQNFCFEKGVC